MFQSRAVVLAGLLSVVISITGCGSEKVPDTPVTPPSTPTLPTIPPPPSTPSLLVSGKVLAGSLPIADAKSLLFLDSDKAVVQFAGTVSI